MKLKALIFTGILLLISTGLRSETKQYLNRVIQPPDAETFVSQAVYITSATCTDNTANGNQVNISTHPAFVYGVFITSAGAAGASVQLFDAQQTTTAVRWLTSPMNAGAERDWIWNVGASSGITARINWGQVAGQTGCVGIIYYEK